jgi:alpha-glucosidase
LLVAPVFHAGQRERTLYLPTGAQAEGWYDFWTGSYWPGGAEVRVPAALDRLPLFVRAGALLPTTDDPSPRKLTEEPSRALRYYPPMAAVGPVTSSAELFEDDGVQSGDAFGRHTVHRFEAVADVVGLRITASQAGGWPLPYSQIRVVLPASERRPLQLVQGAVPFVR